MCGIAGLILSEERNDLEVIGDRMINSLYRRGPDNSGKWFSEKKLLCHTRLSIIDLSDSASQPMFEENKFIIVFNGEIYNFLKLREILISLGHSFQTKSDTEVILKSFKQWGTNCFKKFNGMWALAIYDKEKDNLILSRDRFGIKPLYYYKDQKKIIFGSSIQSIFQSNLIEKKVSNKTLYQFLAYGKTDASQNSFYEQINIFPKSTYASLSLKENTIKIVFKKYWDPEYYVQNKNCINFKDAQKEFLELLENSVRNHSISDTKITSLISGGMDSSTIVCILSSLLNSNTFNKVFHSTVIDKRYDESIYAKKLSNQLNLSLSINSVFETQLISDISKLVEAQGQPFASTGIYLQWKLFENIHNQGYKVVLDGQGADEYLLGYLSFYLPYLLQMIKEKNFIKVASFIKNNFHKKSYWYLLERNFIDALYRLAGLKKKYSTNDKFLAENFLESSLIDKSNIRDFENPLDNKNSLLKNTILKYINQLSLPSLLRYADCNSMYFSIESRVPFLDHSLVEYALSLPDEFLINPRETKVILRSCSSKIVPDFISKRKDKIGFGTPNKEWTYNIIQSDILKDCLNSNFAKDILSKVILKDLKNNNYHSYSYDFLWRISSALLWKEICF